MEHVADPLAPLVQVWARKEGLSPSQKLLLDATAEGLAGAALAARLGVGTVELETLQQLFRARTGRTPSEVVAELEGVAIRRGLSASAASRRRP